MLIIKINVNKKQIDEIHIRNTGKKYGSKDVYEIKKPKCVGTVVHQREDGYRHLLVQALHTINREHRPPTEIDDLHKLCMKIKKK